MRELYPSLAEGDPSFEREAEALAPRVLELSELLADRLELEDVGATFPHRVTYHPTCHSLRMLRVGEAPHRLLRAVRGLELVELPEASECGGFGGTFAVKNARRPPPSLPTRSAASSRRERTSSPAADSSCLLHIGGAPPRSGRRRPDRAPRGDPGGRGVSEGFPAAAREALGNEQLRRNLRVATHTIRAKRAAVVAERPDWAELREAGRAIKERVLRHLDGYLVAFEQAVERAGGSVHWARDAEEAVGVVAALVEARGQREVVKVQPLTTDEIRLNESLAAVGIDVVETDLAELICQLAGEESSHILVPAIHKNRIEIRDLFRRELGLPNLSEQPTELAEAARVHLRERFLRARVAVSGANFAVAETGTLGVVESEGNGRFCTTLPETLITVLGIEKLVPAPEDLEAYLQLLPWSSTGERMNPYTSLWTGVTPGTGRRSSTWCSSTPAGRTCSPTRSAGRRWRASAAARVSTSAPSTSGPAGTRTSRSTPAPSERSSRRSCAGSPPPPRFRTRRALAVPATRSAPSRSTSPRSWSIFVAGSSPSRRPRVGSAPRCASWRGSSPPSADTGRAQRVARIAGRPFARGGRIRRLPGLGAWTETRDLRPVAPPDLPRMVGLAVSAAREEILARIRRALADVPPPKGRPTCRLPEAISSASPRRARPLPRAGRRLRGRRPACLGGRPPGGCRRRLPRGTTSRRVVVPTDLPAPWLPEGVECVPDANLDVHELDALDGAITGCALAIAETGTIVLDAGARQGRRALTLVPDFHLCVVEEEQVVDGVPAAMRRLAATLRAERRPVTFVSGPSATSDIELSRVEGVHGPRRLELVVVRAERRVV